MKNQNISKTLIVLYLPVILAYALTDVSVLSYFVAWFGSFFIFYVTWFSPVRYYPSDLPVYKQIMRPIFLTQFIFASFMCITSIFYFLDHLGYRYLTELNYGAHFKENEKTALIAECQRYCLLGHAAMVTGLLVLIKPNKLKLKYERTVQSDDFLIWMGIIVFIVGSLCAQSSGLFQISLPLITVGISCAAVIFVKGMVTKNAKYIVIGAAVFLSNFITASLSGYKEPIISNLLILICISLPYAKKKELYFGVPICLVILYFLPTYNTAIRSSWDDSINAEDARRLAIANLALSQNQNIVEDTNWYFLTERSSEISMFAQFVDFVPRNRDYYYSEILKNSFLVIIPRVFWPKKPSVEALSMERVYDAGIVTRDSRVSAKTRPIVDGYLSFGIVGVFISMFLYGLIAQHACNLAEKIFGGYELGCVIVFNGIFQGLWRGNNFEFMINNIFYGYIIMWLLCYVLITIKTLTPKYQHFR